MDHASFTKTFKTPSFLSLVLSQFWQHSPQTSQPEGLQEQFWNAETWPSCQDHLPPCQSNVGWLSLSAGGERSLSHCWGYCTQWSRSLRNQMDLLESLLTVFRALCNTALFVPNIWERQAGKESQERRWANNQPQDGQGGQHKEPQLRMGRISKITFRGERKGIQQMGEHKRPILWCLSPT